jgi:putative component of membrane protein insertase Oxa1/YidC/SpoIIIJ protein YidD
MLKRLALALIVLYQKHLSPRKGFSCAYRTCTGGPSCSAFGYRVIRRHGVRKGLTLLDARLDRCADAHRYYSVALRVPASQRGSCDVPCDGPCDSSCDLPCSVCDPFYGCGRDDSRWCRKPGKPAEDRPPPKRRARRPPQDAPDIEYAPRGDTQREVK